MPGTERNDAFLDFRVGFLDQLWLVLICSHFMSGKYTTNYQQPRAGQKGPSHVENSRIPQVTFKCTLVFHFR